MGPNKENTLRFLSFLNVPERGVILEVDSGGRFWKSILGNVLGSILGVDSRGRFWGKMLGDGAGGRFWGSILGVDPVGRPRGLILGLILGVVSEGRF